MTYRILALLTTALAVSACNSDGGDADPADAGALVADAAVAIPDAGAVDAGPLPCTQDQECETGEVCNIAMSPAICVPGRSCETDTDCDKCYDLRDPSTQVDCGHGFHVMSYCDADRGNVCTRMLGVCETCEDDRDCGQLHPIVGGAANKCLDGADGRKVCGRSSALGCPQGFLDDGSGQCIRAGVCPERPTFCPSGTADQGCTGTDQICPGATCPDNTGRCANNDSPGAVGLCIGFCSTNADCPEEAPVCNEVTGLCIAGCTKDGCPGGQVCHADGFCGTPCNDNTACEDGFGADHYCNRPAQPPPRYFKGYHDRFSCQVLGCERPEDCATAGVVCDDTISPAACVPGCFGDNDCSAGEQCKTPGAAGAQTRYSRAECRALPRHPDDGTIGVCCNPGCTNRNLQCGFNQWCCGETESPYEGAASCGTLTSTGVVQADPGQCFDIKPEPFSPFCVQCEDNTACDSGWDFGFNSDPDVNGGQPFQEQEWCTPVAMGLNFCSVTCNPNLPEGGNIGCPRLWNCRPFFTPCMQDADCSGLACIGANPMANPPRPGRCQCGEDGAETEACPSVYPNLDAIENPRCIESGNQGEMFCIASYHCQPPPLSMDAQGDPNYPEACLQ